LPYWDKRIEKKPWKAIWLRAAQQLRRTRQLIVWGYSLPLTDLKARELLRLSFSPEVSVLTGVCVIDPNAEASQRWRRIFLNQRFWTYGSIQEFFKDPPDWYPVSK
jgi:hypothetical protein